LRQSSLRPDSQSLGPDAHPRRFVGRFRRRRCHGHGLAATGSDTGGSIRIPAHYCGLAGFKPTFGLVSKYGALPLAFSLDHVGPITQTIRDSALMLDALAGHDPKDPSSVQRPAGSFVPGPADAADVLKAVRILLPRNYYFENIDPDVRRVVLLAAQAVEAAGGTLVMGPVPDANHLNAVANVTFSVEAASVHEPYLRKRRADYASMSPPPWTSAARSPQQPMSRRSGFVPVSSRSGACPSTRRIAS